MYRIRQITGPDGKPFFYPDEEGIKPYVDSVLFGVDYPDPFPGEYFAETILDIGAHVGSAARLFKARYPNARVIAFEPNPISFGILERNLEGVSDIELVRAGLSDSNGITKLFAGRYSSMQASMLPNEENTAEHVQVDCINAAEALVSRGIERVSIIKLDAEGYEMRILKALGRYAVSADIVYLEYHSEADRRAIDDLFWPGYTLFSAHVSEPHRGTGAYIAEDVLARVQRHSKKPRYAFPKSDTPTAPPDQLSACATAGATARFKQSK